MGEDTGRYSFRHECNERRCILTPDGCSIGTSMQDAVDTLNALLDAKNAAEARAASAEAALAEAQAEVEKLRDAEEYGMWECVPAEQRDWSNADVYLNADDLQTDVEGSCRSAGYGDALPYEWRWDGDLWLFCDRDTGTPILCARRVVIHTASRAALADTASEGGTP